MVVKYVLWKGEAMKISSVFGPTLQGEGKSSGLKVMFIRLAMCNLHCSWCDTKYTWDWKNFDIEKEIHNVSISEIISQLGTEVKSIVISGGEPLLQQNELILLIRQLKGYWIEIETNGTITPQPELVQLVNQFNCSPKLSNSSDSFSLRIKQVPLEKFVVIGKTNFKFVVSSLQDIEEILHLVKTYEMKEVYLMPEGITKEELAEKEEIVKNLCIENGFYFSPRLHITELGGGRLV